MITASARIGLVITTIALSAGCYDSSWGQQKASQARNAQAATPASLEPKEDARPRLAKPTKTMHLRVLATPRFAAETLDWHKQVQALVDDADDVLGPDAGIKIEIDSMSSWSDLTSEDLTKDAVEALHAKDDAHDVDWVAGFIGGISKVEPSFHELGRGDEPGKYVVLRAVTLGNERDEIERRFDRLSEDERTRLAKARRQHRAVSVFLHEIGHTLGALHERDVHSLMNPIYDPKMAGFSPAALALMKVSLDQRDHLRSGAEWTTYAQALLGVLNGPSKDAWIPTEREDFAKRLNDVVDRNHTSAAPAPPDPPPASSTPTPTAPEPAADEPLLAEKDRPIYSHAVELFRAGDLTGAAATAKPLFKAYPKVLSVQDLRCQIDMKTVGWPAAEKACAAVQKLSR